MYARLNILAAHGRANAARRQLRCQDHYLFDPRSSSRGFRVRSSDSSSYVSLVGNPRGPVRPRALSRQQNTSISFSSSLHTTSKSLAPPSSAALQQQDGDEFDDELEQEIELFSSSCLSQLLPNEIVQEDEGEIGVASYSSSKLDQELGIDSVWESRTEEEEDEKGIVEEQQMSSTSTTTTTNNKRDKRRSDKKSAMALLRNFNPENPPPSDDPEELQLWLECAAQREAVTRYQNLVEKARDRKAYDSMSLMQRHVVQWYQGIRDTMEIRQKEYLSNQDTRRAKKRYGPFLCSLHPEKMAVILSHEAITQALLMSGKNGQEGVPLVKMAHAVGGAVETEVVSQRRIKERFHDAKKYSSEDDDDESENDESNADADKNHSQDGERDESGKTKMTAMDRWTFSASHLKLFMDELKRIDPKLGKSKRAINYAMRRAKQAMNSEENWSSEDITHLGAALLSILIENATIIENGKEEPAFRVEKRWSDDHKTKTTSYIVLNDNLHKLFMEDEFISWAASTTRHTPMIVPPTDWTGPNEGGYRWLKTDLMRTHGSQSQKEALEQADLSLVSDGLNILGKTAWKINKEILSTSRHCWENNIAIGDIPSKDDYPVPLEPMRPDRIAPEVYSDTENPVTQAAVAANRVYRQSMYKINRWHQKNMVRIFEVVGKTCVFTPRSS
jgi:hypothetical protein